MMCDFGYGIWQDAYDEGKMELAQNMACKLFERGHSPEEISELVGFDIKTVNKWLSEVVPA